MIAGKLNFEQRELENTVEVQRLTISRITDKFEANGSVQNVHKKLSG